MENNFLRRIPTDIDLNGPVLAYTTQPSDATKSRGDSVTFTVAAEATFPGNTGADNSGTIAFQWYEGEGQALTNGGNISGATSASLSISDLDTPADDGRNFYCEISYTAGDEYDSTDKGTGIALNQPLKSSVATLSMNPLLEIVSQPSNATVYTNVAATHTISAKLTDNSGAVTYQWYVGVENATPTLVENKTYRTQNIERETITVIDENFVTDTNYFSESRSFGTGDSSVNIPPTGYNVTFTVAGAGGGTGGNDGGGPGGGGAGGRIGNFSIPNSRAQGRQFNFRIGSQGGGGGRGTFPAFGRAGGSNIAPGGRGGGAGPQPWSGGGGGGGGASGVLRDNGLLLAVCGGGGGGGGGSHNRGGGGGGGALGVSGSPFTSSIPTTSGGQGEDGHDDGGGGGGAGGGISPRRSGGRHGHDNSQNSGGGQGGRSGYRSDYVSFTGSPGNNRGQGYGSINYSYTTSTTRPVKTPREVINEIITYQNTVISGQGTPTLSITSDNAEFNNTRQVYCVVSNSTASNSPLTSDTVSSAVTDPTEQDRIIIEAISSSGIANIQEVNLLNGEEEIKSGSSTNTGEGGYLYSIYAPDKDIEIEMDLFGGKGRDYRNGKVGGEGGYSRIKFTLDQNIEYVIAGLNNSINTPFIYRGANLLAVVGGGGDAGLNGDGGRGGGIGLSGEQGRNIGGLPGDRVAEGTLGANGIWSRLIDPPTGVYAGDSQVDITSTSGGRTIKCTKGDYWATQGKTACESVNPMDLGLRFRMANGDEVTATAALGFRGYKDGYAIQHTGGLGRANSRTDSAVGPPDHANGGNGATGGSGGIGYSSAGGGSGYSNGTVEVVDTQLGGSNVSKAIVFIRRVV